MIGPNHLYISHDAMFGAKIEHLLSFWNAANHRIGYRTAFHDQVENFRRFMRCRRRTNQRHGAITLQQGGKIVEIMWRSYCIQNEIETLQMSRHLIGIA
ncbi:Uncharacterised protein [Shigella sonnei]|nr:Uncharacterised protein [Shigella sonnei]